MAKRIYVIDGQEVVIDDGIDDFTSPAVSPSSTDPKLCPREIVFTVPGSPSATVAVVEDGSGNLDFTVSVDTSTNQNADISGLFFQFNDQKLATLSASGDPQITQFVTGDDSVINLKNGVNMNGAGVTPFDVGIEFGLAGIGSDHQNIQTTSFVLSDAAHDLTTDDFHQAGEASTVGIRTLSVGQKLVGTAPFAPRPTIILTRAISRIRPSRFQSARWRRTRIPAPCSSSIRSGWDRATAP